MTLALLAARLFAFGGLLHIGSPYPSCAAAGISTPAGRDGICARGGGLFSSATVYNVVDRAQVLAMPEYEARLLRVEVAPTTVDPAPGTAALYPHDEGRLVSAEISITNTSGKPLSFGPGVPEGPVPSYSAKSTPIELALPQSLGSEVDRGFPAILNGKGAPRPSVFPPTAIPAGGTITGWASFVAPPSARESMSARPADIDFFRSDNDPHYVGQIRLWK